MGTLWKKKSETGLSRLIYAWPVRDEHWDDHITKTVNHLATNSTRVFGRRLSLVLLSATYDGRTDGETTDGRTDGEDSGRRTDGTDGTTDGRTGWTTDGRDGRDVGRTDGRTGWTTDGRDGRDDGRTDGRTGRATVGSRCPPPHPPTHPRPPLGDAGSPPRGAQSTHLTYKSGVSTSSTRYLHALERLPHEFLCLLVAKARPTPENRFKGKNEIKKSEVEFEPV